MMQKSVKKSAVINFVFPGAVLTFSGVSFFCKRKKEPLRKEQYLANCEALSEKVRRERIFRKTILMKSV
jgi:hypothetical protein